MKNTLTAVTLALLGTALAAPKISPQSIIVNPVQSDVQVRVWVNKDPNGNATPVYRPGEQITLFTTVNQDAYVYLFDVDARGTITQILPNRYSSGDNFLRANTTKQFPAAGDQFTFDIAEPYGLSKVLAVASKTPLNLDQITSFQNGQSFGTARVQGQQQLAQALSIVVNPLPQNSWVSDTALYSVEPRNPVRTATLFVATDAPDASVYLNDRLLGSANTSFTNIAAGNYRLRVTAPGYAPYTANIPLRAGGTASVNVTLAQTRATLRLSSNVEGASVFLDGRQVGNIKNGGLNLNVDRGSYQVVVVAPGYRSFVADVNLQGDASLPANLTRK